MPYFRRRSGRISVNIALSVMCILLKFEAILNRQNLALVLPLFIAKSFLSLQNRIRILYCFHKNLLNSSVCRIFSQQHLTSTPNHAAQNKSAKDFFKKHQVAKQILLKFKYFLRPFGQVGLAYRFGKSN